ALIKSPRDIVDKIIGTLCTKELAAQRLFPTLHEQFWENVCRASGRAPDKESSKPLIQARDSNLAPQELVETYLRNTPFLDLLSTPIPLILNPETRFSGHWIIAPPGRGKTTLLHAMVL